jgi:hypothetical protein
VTLAGGAQEERRTEELENLGVRILAGSGYFSRVSPSETGLSEPDLMLRLSVDARSLGGWPTFFHMVTLGVIPVRTEHRLIVTGDLRSADGHQLASLFVAESLTEWTWIGFAPTLAVPYAIARQRSHDDVFRSVLVQMIEQEAI